MAGSTITTAAHITKKLYLSGELPTELAKRDHPYFEMIMERSNYFGEEAIYSWRHTHPQAIAGDFGNAQTQAGSSSSKGLKPAMTPATKYGVIRVGGVDMLRTKNNQAAFVRLFRHEAEGLFDEMGDNIAFDLYREGNGQRGQRASISTDTVTLTDFDTARNFKIGMTVIASANADGSSPRTGSTTVAAVNLDLGQVTLTSAAAITSFADNDYLFRQGDPGTCSDGLEDLTPLTAPAIGESFRGVDRGVYPELNAGVRVNDSTIQPEEAIGLAAVKISQNGGRADCAYLNPVTHWAISRRLNAKVEYEGAGGSADYGFEYFMIHNSGARIKTYADPDCPVNRIRICKKSDCLLAHADPVVHIINDDGNYSLRISNEDGLEQRVRSVIQQYQLRPRSHGVALAV